MITDTKLRKALGKKRDDIETISDSHGLNARISQAGKVSFFYRYRWAGKAVKLNVGDYPAMSIPGKGKASAKYHPSFFSNGPNWAISKSNIKMPGPAARATGACLS